MLLSLSRGNFYRYYSSLSFLSQFLFFFSEINRIDLHLTIEVWNKGMIWDTLLGSSFVALRDVPHTNEVRSYQHHIRNSSGGLVKKNIYEF